MKKMSEVFELPVRQGEGNIENIDLFDSRGIWQAAFNDHRQVEAAAHAINHVDTLADALAALIDGVTNRSQHDHINNQIIAAVRALAAYRGEK